VPDDSFQLECDRLSHIVDRGQCEHLRWERNEGPMLARLVALAHAAFEGRSEFELGEEGASRSLKRFVLKVHGKRVLVVTMRIEDDRAVLQAETLDRGGYALADAAPVSAEFASVDEAWMAGALEQQFRRIQAPAG
jgi:hypothetical protein